MQVYKECAGRLYSGFDAGVPHEREELNNDQCVRGPALTKPEKKKFRGKRDSGHGREISLVYFPEGRRAGVGVLLPACCDLFPGAAPAVRSGDGAAAAGARLRGGSCWDSCTAPTWRTWAQQAALLAATTKTSRSSPRAGSSAPPCSVGGARAPRGTP